MSESVIVKRCCGCGWNHSHVLADERGYQCPVTQRWIAYMDKSASVQTTPVNRQDAADVSTKLGNLDMTPAPGHSPEAGKMVPAPVDYVAWLQSIARCLSGPPPDPDKVPVMDMAPLESLADTLSALRDAVNGCGEERADGMGCQPAHLCHSCKVQRGYAIATLTATPGGAE